MKRIGAPPALLVAMAGIGAFSAMDAVMKGLVRAIGAYDAIFWRGLIGCLLGGALYLAARRGPPAPLLRVHAPRGVLMAGMALLFFWGLARVPMAQAVALTFLAPLLSLGLSAALLKERIGAATILASVVALGGVGVILAGQARAPAGDETALGSAAILISALCYAFNIVLMRRQAQAAGAIEIAAFQNLIVTGTLLLAAPFIAHLPPPEALPSLMLSALLSLLSGLLLAWAYARAEASYLAMSEYTAFLWAACFGFLVFGERVSPYTLAGAALIVGGCLVSAWRRPPPPLAAAEGAI